MLDSLQDGLDPDTAPPFLPPPIELTLDQFLQHVVLILNAQPHSVKDVIKFAANAAGAVHHDPKPRREFALIKAVSEGFRLFDVPLAIRELQPISRVTLKAIQPLRDDCRLMSR
jgi:hypothetical protein